MMPNRIHSERMKELVAMSQGLYGTIHGLTNDPQEFITILSMLHLTLWLNCGDGPIEGMLKTYSDNLIANCNATSAEQMKQ